ncbi:MAG: hypothetical protein HQK51_17780 [Oligoflexia bacterium]|nr:hypothetical protein [Oligoflexia bacterium]
MKEYLKINIALYIIFLCLNIQANDNNNDKENKRFNYLKENFQGVNNICINNKFGIDNNCSCSKTNNCFKLDKRNLPPEMLKDPNISKLIDMANEMMSTGQKNIDRKKIDEIKKTFTNPEKIKQLQEYAGKTLKESMKKHNPFKDSDKNKEDSFTSIMERGLKIILKNDTMNNNIINTFLNDMDKSKIIPVKDETLVMKKGMEVLTKAMQRQSERGNQSGSYNQDNNGETNYETKNIINYNSNRGENLQSVNNSNQWQPDTGRSIYNPPSANTVYKYNSINKQTETNIFKIISNRYKLSFWKNFLNFSGEN